MSHSTHIEHASDEDIVLYIINRKNTALFGVLYDRYAQKVYSKCRSFTKDQQEAEDLTHDILLKVYLKLGEFAFKAKFSTWLYSITYHFCIDYKRKSDKQMENFQQYAADTDTEEEDDAALIQIKVELLRKLLEKISPEDKALLLMKYQDELPIQEISGITQLSESAVKMRLKRAKEKIVSMAKAVTL